MKATRFCLLISACFALLAAQTARFEEAKRVGLGYIRAEQYDKAAGRLEEVWEQDKSDPMVGEYLALAYLNSEDHANHSANQAQGFEIIRKLASQESRVTFTVIHSHETMSWLQGRQWNQYCRGRLSISPSRLVFISEKGEKAGEHSFDIDGHQSKTVYVNPKEQRGIFQIKTGESSYLMATRTASFEEAALIVDLIRQKVMSK